MTKYDNNSNHELNDVHAEIGALKLIIKELIHLVDESKLNELKKTVSLDQVHEILVSSESEKGVISSKANRIARSLIDKVLKEKSHP